MEISRINWAKPRLKYISKIGKYTLLLYVDIDRFVVCSLYNNHSTESLFGVLSSSLRHHLTFTSITTPLWCFAVVFTCPLTFAATVIDIAGAE